MSCLVVDSVYVVGNTHRFYLTAMKDGVIWDISTSTIYLYLIKPDGTILTKSATVISGPAGTAYYITLTTDLDVSGDWLRQWRVVDGAIDVRSEILEFYVHAQNVAV